MHRRRVCLMALVLAHVLAVAAQTPAPPPPVVIKPPSNNTYPQIVRIRSLEGDVRVSRGKAIEKQTGSTWDQAEVDLPIESGFNLVTGTGRAEFEFEDGSTAYLDDDSALSIDDVHTTAAIPHTQITLLAGTLTLHVKPASAGSSFILKTPTDNISVSYPEKLFARIDSYVDAIAITPQKDESFDVTGIAGQKAAAGATVFYSNGQLIPQPVAFDPRPYAEWDNWVKTRVALRSAALASVTAASGLPTSLPGLADLNGQGVFFTCPGYGTCWEPPSEDDAATDNSPPAPSAQGPEFDIFLAPSTVTATAGAQVTAKLSAVGLLGFTSPIEVVASLPSGITCVTTCAGQFSPGELLTTQFAIAANLPDGKYPVTFTAKSGPLIHSLVFTIYLYSATDAVPFLPAAVPYFPCFPTGLRPALLHDGVRGRDVALHFRYGPGTLGYAWSVCHTGYWIYRAHLYVWVVPKGTELRRHHHYPDTWINCGKQRCYVPRHPRDVTGNLPLNAKHEVYSLTDKDGKTIERRTLDAKEKVELLGQPPKQFRKPVPLPLNKSSEPRIEAHEMKYAFASTTERAAEPKTYLAFDQKSHSFLLSTEGADAKHKPTTQTFEARRNDLRVHNDHVEAPGKTRTAGATHAGAATHTRSATHSSGSAHTGGASHAGGGHTGGGGHSGGSSGHSGGSGHH